MVESSLWGKGQDQGRSPLSAHPPLSEASSGFSLPGEGTELWAWSFLCLPGILLVPRCLDPTLFLPFLLPRCPSHLCVGCAVGLGLLSVLGGGTLESPFPLCGHQRLKAEPPVMPTHTPAARRPGTPAGEAAGGWSCRDEGGSAEGNGVSRGWLLPGGGLLTFPREGALREYIGMSVFQGQLGFLEKAIGAESGPAGCCAVGSGSIGSWASPPVGGPARPRGLSHKEARGVGCGPGMTVFRGGGRGRGIGGAQPGRCLRLSFRWGSVCRGQSGGIWDTLGGQILEQHQKP